MSACHSIGSGLRTVEVSELSPSGFPQEPTHQRNSDNEKYVIKPGDQLSVKFFFNPELNEEELIVRPDGYISLQLVHEIKAAGLTPSDLTRLLAEQYAGQLKNPEIAVIVRSIKEAKRIYVDGQVGAPGEFEMIGPLTVLQAITLARGMKEDMANKREVVVIRRDQNNDPFAIRVNLEAALSGRDLSQDIQLLPHDTVYVPRSFW
ncbi:polysaccharide biosynthesis/export family protein [Nitrospira sp. M1]